MTTVTLMGHLIEFMDKWGLRSGEKGEALLPILLPGSRLT